MHKHFVSLVALGAFALIASPVQAEKWQTLGGNHSKEEIKGTCKKFGGTFFEDITGGNYSCVKNGGGSVSCEKGGKCWGCGTGGTASGCQEGPS
jgi:hypothetical protein